MGTSSGGTRGLLPIILVGLLGVVSAVVAGLTWSTTAETTARADALAATGLTGYLPEILDSRPTHVEAVGDRVAIDYVVGGSPYLTVYLVPTPADLCGLLGEVDQCERGELGGGERVATGSFEEMSSVAVTRGETTILVNGVVTEAARPSIDDVVDSFANAPAQSWLWLVRQ